MRRYYVEKNQNLMGGGNPSVNIVQLYYMGKAIYTRRNESLVRKVSFRLFSYYYNRIAYKYGVSIPLEAECNGKIVISHACDIFVNPNSVLNGDIFIMQGVTIGGVRGKGSPKIGNRVVLSAGVKVIGNVRIGDNVMVGANAVVVKDIPSGATVVGNPGRVINMNGKENVNYYFE